MAQIRNENWKAALTRLLEALAQMAELGCKLMAEEAARRQKGYTR